MRAYPKGSALDGRWQGVNRWTTGQRRQRFAEARGETGECAAALELGARLGLFDAAETEEAMLLCGRITAMLTALLKKTG